MTFYVYILYLNLQYFQCSKKQKKKRSVYIKYTLNIYGNINGKKDVNSIYVYI